VVAVVAVVVAGMRVVRVGIGLFDGGLVDGSVVGDLFNFRHLLVSGLSAVAINPSIPVGTHSTLTKRPVNRTALGNGGSEAQRSVPCVVCVWRG